MEQESLKHKHQLLKVMRILAIISACYLYLHNVIFQVRDLEKHYT